MNTTTTEKNRARLLNIIHGGDGRTDSWIERVTIRKHGQADSAGYVVHVMTPHCGEMCVQVGSIEAAQGLWHATRTGGKPRERDYTEEEVAAMKAAYPTPEDCGRIIEQ